MRVNILMEKTPKYHWLSQAIPEYSVVFKTLLEYLSAVVNSISQGYSDHCWKFYILVNNQKSLGYFSVFPIRKFKDWLLYFMFWPSLEARYHGSHTTVQLNSSARSWVLISSELKFVVSLGTSCFPHQSTSGCMFAHMSSMFIKRIIS